MRTRHVILMGHLIAVAIVFNVAMNAINHVDPPVDIMRKDQVRYRVRTNWKMGSYIPDLSSYGEAKKTSPAISHLFES